jgi:hypothetical protein
MTQKHFEKKIKFLIAKSVLNFQTKAYIDLLGAYELRYFAMSCIKGNESHTCVLIVHDQWGFKNLSFMTRKTKRQGREKAHEAQLIKLIERERERERERRELIRTS